MRCCSRVLGLGSLAILVACGDSDEPRCSSDAACGRGSFCSAGACVNDTAAPVLHITSPASGQVVVTTTLALEGSFDDGAGAGVTSAEYSTGGASFTPLEVVAGGFSAQVPIPVLDGAPVTLTVRGTDRAGNAVSASVGVTVDDVPPVVTIAGDDAACTPLCSGAVVRAVDSGHSLSGTAADGSGLRGGTVSLRLTDDGGTEVAAAVVSASPEWSHEWDVSALTDDGRLYTLVVTATDEAGNASHAARQIYVDRVLPTFDVPASVSYERHVDPAATLLAFSEPMDAASVRAVTTVTRSSDSTVLPLATFDAADGMAFGFAAGTLEPYTRYDLAVAPGAIDVAGNAATTSRTSAFQTELVPPASGFSPESTTARHPRIATDIDGRPFVLYATSGSPRLAYWDGRGSWVDTEVPLAGVSGAEPADLGIWGGEASAEPYVDVRALFRVAATGAVHYAFTTSTTDLAGWGGVAAAGSPDALASGAVYGWRPSFQVRCGMFMCSYLVTFAAAGGAQYVELETGSWSAPTPFATVSDQVSAAGAAFADGATVQFLTLGLPAHVDTGLEATGVVVGPKARDGGTAHVAFVRTVGAFPYFDVRVYLACRGEGAWPSVIASSGPLGAPALDLATSETTVALAVERTTGSVRFGTTPNGDCSGPPVAPTWQLEVTDAREPAVALGADGASMWMAYVTRSTGRLTVTP